MNTSNPKNLSSNEIVSFLLTELTNVGFSKLTIASHRRNAKKLVKFMEINNLPNYSKSVGENFLLANYEKVALYQYKSAQSTINWLNRILHGEKTRKHLCALDFPDSDNGKLGQVFMDYIRQRRLSSISEYEYGRQISMFLRAMDTQSVHIGTLSREFIIQYVSASMEGITSRARCIRVFLQYLFEKELITVDYSPLLRSFKKKPPEAPISFYDPEEVAKLEASINRKTPKGKRDYAMILLASRLGLRNSDIVLLKFSNLDWDNSRLTIIQYKTKREVRLPITLEVGNALIDYLLNARPKIQSPFVFLSTKQPYKPLNGITDIVKRHFDSSGIKINGRRRGPHSLRHSLATTMLNNGTSLPIISEALGHSTTRSTMAYLSVGVNGLLECSLPVPIVPNSFYLQRDGIFYEEI